MANLKTFSDFQKTITVTDWYCGKDGLEIHYHTGEKELSIMPNPETGAKLLESIGVLEASQLEGDDVWVQVMVDGPAGEKAVWIPWEQFTLSFDLSQYEAINCAAWHESEKHFQSLLKMGGCK